MDETWVLVEPSVSIGPPVIHDAPQHYTVHSLQPYMTPIGISDGLLRGMIHHMSENKMMRALYMQHTMHLG